MWRGAVSCGGEQSLVEGNGLKRKGAIAGAGGGERSQVAVGDRWWRGAITGGEDSLRWR